MIAMLANREWAWHFVDATCFYVELGVFIKHKLFIWFPCNVEWWSYEATCNLPQCKEDYPQIFLGSQKGDNNKTQFYEY